MAQGAPKNAIKAGNALAYPLVASVYGHINMASMGRSDTVLGHLNLVAFKYATLKAMLPLPADPAQDTPQDNNTRLRMKWIDVRLSLLLSSYEPAIDLYPYAYKRRAQVMQYVFDLLADELALINDKKVVSSGQMAACEAQILNTDRISKVISEG